MNHPTELNPIPLLKEPNSHGESTVANKQPISELRMESLFRISRYEAKSIQDLMDYALHEAVALTGSKVGYVFYYDERTQLFTLNSWSKEALEECAIVDKPTTYKLEDTGIWFNATNR